MDSQNAFYGLITVNFRVNGTLWSGEVSQPRLLIRRHRYRSLTRLTFLLFVGICILCSTASAEVAVSTAVDGQFLPWVVDDGEGGVIVMWEDYRTGKDWDVYAQRVDSAKKNAVEAKRIGNMCSR